MNRKRLATSHVYTFILLLVAIVCALSFSSCSKTNVKGHPQYFDTVIRQADYLIKSGNPARAFLFLDSAYAAFPKADNFDRYRKYEMLSGFFSEISKDYNQAIIYSDSMIEMLKDDSELVPNEYIDALSGRGSILFNQKRYNDAFYYFYRAEAMAKEYSDPCSYAGLSNSLGMVLYSQEKYRLALSYFKAADREVSVCSKTNITKAFMRRQMYIDNIALCYEHLGVPDSAILYYDRTLNVIDRADSIAPDKRDRLQSARGVVYGNLGSIFLKTGKLKEAEAFFLKSIAINNHVGFDRHDAQFNGIKLAQVYILSGRPDDAYKTMQWVRVSLDSLPYDQAELRWRKQLYQYYDTIGDISKAYAAYRDYVDYKDSFDAARKNLLGADFNKTFENLSQQSQIASLKKDNKVETSYLILAVAIAIMVIIILYLIWNNYRTSKNNVKDLTILNAHINDQNIAIQLQAEGLQELNTFKDKILTIISHDLRSPLNSLTSLIGLMEEDLPPDEIQFVKEGINKQLVSVNELVDTLLRWAASSFHNSHRDAEPLSLSKIAQQNVDLLKHIAQSKSIHFHNNIPESAIALGNYDQINVVIRNILTNGIKFTNVNGNITLAATENGNTVTFSISDTGVGMTQDQVNKLFTHAHSTTYGTEGEKGTGLGLLLSKEYIENNGGSIAVTSEINKGTTFTISLQKAIS